MKQFLIILNLTFAASWIMGQVISPDSVYTLPGFEVSDTRMREFTAGQKVQRLDSAAISASGTNGLGEMLYRNTALNINRYNLNGLNLLSVRGTTAAQSSVYWNGFQLNPPNIGLIDLSIIPGNYFNDISILYGGSSSLYGSGNIGAGIHLNNDPEFQKIQQITLGASLASFNDYSAHARGIWASPKWYFKTQLMGRTARNDFSYEKLNGDEDRFRNAKLEQKGFMQDIYHKLNKNNIAGISFWYQENKKEIPATLTSKPSDAWQHDRSLRGIASYTHFLPKGHFSFKLAAFHDYEHYVDPDSLPSLVINSEIETMRLQGEVTYKKQLGQYTIVNLGAEVLDLQGKSVNYPERIIQKQGGVSLLISQHIPSIRWVANLKARQDFNSDFDVPFTPALGLEGPLWKNISLKGSVSRNFRVPTFNDLYWIPGGNPDLKPESSWNEELGLYYQTDSLLYFDLKTEITAFNSLVDNWIMWIPGNNLWSPMNIRTVWSRGIEGSINLSARFNTFRVHLKGNYNYTRSTNQKQLSDHDPTYQKQLIYVPEHRYQLGLDIDHRQWHFSVNQAYTGHRFVTPDNEDKLEPYSLIDLKLQRQMNFQKNKLVISAEVLNLLNENYQAVQYYPMPGRSFKISVLLIIQQP